jgi:hypothetical protein
MKSPGVSSEGLEALRQRGNLTPEQILRLTQGGKPACHSDKVADTAQARLVQLNTLKAHGVTVNETGL